MLSPQVSSDLVRREGASFTTGERKDRRLGADSRCRSNGLEASLDGPTVWRQRSAGPELLVGFDGLQESHVQFLFAHGFIIATASTIETIYCIVQLSKAQGPETCGDNDGHVSQVFAVYPERPELITRSTLIKIEGFLGDDELAGEWRSREGWLLLMPEVETGKLASLEMLKWLIGKGARLILVHGLHSTIHLTKPYMMPLG